MKKLSLVIAALAVSGAIEFAVASSHHNTNNGSTLRAYTNVTDTIPKKRKKGPDTLPKYPTPQPVPPTPAPSPTPTPNPTPPTPNPNPSPTPPVPSPNPSPNPSPSPTPKPPVQ